MDLERYALTGKEELARNRMSTMRDIRAFMDEPDAEWEKGVWDKAVRGWEKDNRDKQAEAKAASKADRANAAASAKREAEKAASKAKREAEAGKGK